jgi:hypothetical protein
MPEWDWLGLMGMTIWIILKNSLNYKLLKVSNLVSNYFLVIQDFDVKKGTSIFQDRDFSGSQTRHISDEIKNISKRN